MALPKLETPTFELVLPSTNKKVKFRPFLVKEHKILLTMSEAEESEVSRIIRELVDVCTFNKLDVDNLPHFDIEYIFMMLRAKSIGETVEVYINCDCGTKIDTAFNIENLEVIKDPEHTNKVMITDNLGVELNYPKFDSVVQLYNTKDKSKVFELVLQCINAVFDSENYWSAKEQSRAELEEFINSLTKSQFEKIEQFFTTSPKIVQTIESDCPQCSKHNVSKLEGLHNFFV